MLGGEEDGQSGDDFHGAWGAGAAGCLWVSGDAEEETGDRFVHQSMVLVHF